MKIYVAGPYSAPIGTAIGEVRQKIEENIAEADSFARRLVDLGHTPFVPHTMMRSWEDEKGVDRKAVERICNEWIAQCDALLFLGSSPGANIEKAIAESLGLPIFTRESLPSIKALDTAKKEDLKEIYLAEYAQCADSYRHTYQTIWSAGSVFFAVSGGILALQAKSGSAGSAALWALALLPIWFWYLAIFRPMDRYGQVRRKRLADIETIFNQKFPPIAMAHFLDKKIKGQDFCVLRFICEPRVKWYVTFVGLGLTTYELTFGVCKLINTLHPTWCGWVN
jgi:hypothetical protein